MKVALVLGSGGARGYAHIGVIDELLARGHEIAGVSGSSMGALVGGVYAAGKLEEFTEWATSLTQTSVIRLLDPSLTGPGLIKAGRVLSEISRMLGGALIEDLPIPFTAVATDITKRREVWFQEGPLDMAIRASIAIPSIILPVRLHGSILVDGGVLNPLPLEPIAPVRAEATVAVRLSLRHVTPEPEEEEGGGVRDFISDTLRRGVQAVSRFRTSFANSAELESTNSRRWDEDFEALPSDLGALDVMNQSIETMQAMIERYRMATFPPSVVVDVPLDSASVYDFHHAGRLIDLGRELAAAQFDEAGL